MTTSAAFLDPEEMPAPERSLSEATRRSAVLQGQVRTASDTVSSHHPTSAGLRQLLGGNGLKRGASYVVDGSMSLALALSAGPSAAGAWCGVVGVPGFGSQSAAGLGIDLDRVALVPQPGHQWLEVVAALVDALDLIVVRPPTPPKDSEVRRFAGRLRQRGASLVVVGPHGWPGCELRLSVSGSRWQGMGTDGHGHLSARTALVSATGRGSAGHPKTMRMWLPDADGRVRPVDSEAFAAELPNGAETRPLLRRVR